MVEARTHRESQMVEKRRRYDPDFRADAIRIVTETGKSCAEAARVVAARRIPTLAVS